uniref:Chondroitin proteoglycan 4 domain-containing protein n=1 Tax=Panagrolaimus sp. JU765 TaxID=591449 RepID=A0AC34QZS3_9BILA
MIKNLIFILFVVEIFGQNEIPECVRECLKPLVRLQKTNADIYVKYEETCDKLEPAAECAKKCGAENHAIFHQVTTNYRIHCTEYEEELEDHLPCLARNAVTADSQCKKDCKIDITSDNQVAACKRTECLSICLVKKLAHTCPKAEGILKKISVKRAKELEIAREHQDFKLMPLECQNLHDSSHVERILEEL